MGKATIRDEPIFLAALSTMEMGLWGLRAEPMMPMCRQGSFSSLTDLCIQFAQNIAEQARFPSKFSYAFGPLWPDGMGRFTTQKDFVKVTESRTFNHIIVVKPAISMIADKNNLRFWVRSSEASHKDRDRRSIGVGSPETSIVPLF